MTEVTCTNVPAWFVMINGAAAKNRKRKLSTAISVSSETSDSPVGSLHLPVNIWKVNANITTAKIAEMQIKTPHTKCSTIPIELMWPLFRNMKADRKAMQVITIKAVVINLS